MLRGNIRPPGSPAVRAWAPVGSPGQICVPGRDTQAMNRSSSPGLPTYSERIGG
jgi:hypothetical protein